ncbi:MAG: helix-turn-helix transcriptional regulator [Chloroflexi bacterium]|nr:MAG: helix-turn-helix transcriptional regulator [Chloroflexota bacterium]
MHRVKRPFSHHRLLVHQTEANTGSLLFASYYGAWPAARLAAVKRTLGAQARQCDERLTRAFTLLGKRWSGVILGVLLEGPAHFAVLARTIPGISERMLSDRLDELSRAGLIDRRVLDGPPLGVIYQLTESGRAIGPGLLKLGEWADRYMAIPQRRKTPRSRRTANA